MRVLIVDDEHDQREALRNIVHGWGHQTRVAADGVEAMRELEAFNPSVVITDLKMPRMDGFELLKSMKAQGRARPTIVLTAFGSLDMAVSTIHDLGGFWFLEKPVNVGALEVLLERAGSQSRLTEENEQLRRELSYRGVLCELIGHSKMMQEVFAVIRQVAPTNAPVLITGESGTGKELVARAIHSLSPRRENPFIAVNCAALPETLIESELFGHEKGAFTGAVDRRIGAIEMASHGTLFLDELGEMPVQMQAKLLRVLEDFRVRRLGAKQEVEVDIRVLAATNRIPAEAIQDGKLREDLYYRLNVIEIHLPPLRQRKEDIPHLVEAMIHTMNRRHGTRVGQAAPETLEALIQLNWGGNIRELRNVVERAVILAGEGDLAPLHLPPKRPATAAEGNAAEENGTHPPVLGIRVGTTIEDAERILLEATLLQTQGNKTRAAMILGISTKTLHAKLKQYALQAQESESDA